LPFGYGRRVRARECMIPLSDCVREDDALPIVARKVLALPRPALLTADGQAGGVLRHVDVVRAVAIGKLEVAQQPHSVSVPADCPLEEVERTMVRESVGQVLVTDPEVVGVISREHIETWTSEAPDGLPLPTLESMSLVGEEP